MNESSGRINARGKVFRDPVHGLIRIESEDAVLLDLIDTPEFQRLRRIRQLGVSCLTYPGAEHSRFQHSLGVLHFAQRILAALEHRYRHESQAAQLIRDHARTVKCAALLHDVGHGPFSHMIERAFGALSDHEQRTVDVIMAPDSGVNQTLRAHGVDPETVRDLIKKASPHRLLVDIVSSQLDADRMDYILRDALATGVKYGAFDSEWLLGSLCIGSEPQSDNPADPTQWRLCLDERRGLHSAEQLIVARLHMSLQVYYHRATRGWEAHLLCLFKQAAELARESRLPGATPELVTRFFASDGGLSLAESLLCDEASLVCAMQVWAGSSAEEYRDLAELSSAFLYRKKLYLGHELGGMKSGQVMRLAHDLHQLGKENLDWLLDPSEFSSYKDFDSIFATSRHKEAGRSSTAALLLSSGTLGEVSRPVEQDSAIFQTLGKSRGPTSGRVYSHRRISEKVRHLLAG